MIKNKTVVHTRIYDVGFDTHSSGESNALPTESTGIINNKRKIFLEEKNLFYFSIFVGTISKVIVVGQRAVAG